MTFRTRQAVGHAEFNSSDGQNFGMRGADVRDRFGSIFRKANFRISTKHRKRVFSAKLVPKILQLSRGAEKSSRPNNGDHFPERPDVSPIFSRTHQNVGGHLEKSFTVD